MHSPYSWQFAASVVHEDHRQVKAFRFRCDGTRREDWAVFGQKFPSE